MNTARKKNDVNSKKDLLDEEIKLVERKLEAKKVRKKHVDHLGKVS